MAAPARAGLQQRAWRGKPERATRPRPRALRVWATTRERDTADFRAARISSHSAMAHCKTARPVFHLVQRRAKWALRSCSCFHTHPPKPHTHPRRELLNERAARLARRPTHSVLRKSCLTTGVYGAAPATEDAYPECSEVSSVACGAEEEDPPLSPRRTASAASAPKGPMSRKLLAACTASRGPPRVRSDACAGEDSVRGGWRRAGRGRAARRPAEHLART